MAKTKPRGNRDDLDALAASIVKSFGKDTAIRGGLQRQLNTVPTGSLALDYELGIGGWPLGGLVCVFGPRDIGKSSMIGLNGVANAQRMGKTAAWVALEPFDEEWAKLNGVDVEEMLVAYPTTGEEAFGMLRKIVASEVVDFVVFDSIGAVLSEGEMDEDGKPRQGGQAGLITWAVKAVAPLAIRNNVCVILLNQVRDNMKSRIPGVVQQPGGHALEHMSSIIVQLKRGSGRYTVKQNGTDVQVGGEIIAHILRNKMAQGTGQKAVFDYFYAETPEYPFGIDTFNDVLNTAKRTGVIQQAGAYYTLPDGERIKSIAAVAEHLQQNPEAFTQVREGVLEAMLHRNARTVLPGEETEDA